MYRPFIKAASSPKKPATFFVAGRTADVRRCYPNNAVTELSHSRYEREERCRSNQPRLRKYVTSFTPPFLPRTPRLILQPTSCGGFLPGDATTGRGFHHRPEFFGVAVDSAGSVAVDSAGN